MDQESVEFLAERALLDHNLALLNTPVTLTLETDADGITKRLTTYGQVSSKTSLAEMHEVEANGGISPIRNITIFENIDSDTNSIGRFSHLWAIAPTLPRKAVVDSR